MKVLVTDPIRVWVPRTGWTSAPGPLEPRAAIQKRFLTQTPTIAPFASVRAKVWLSALARFTSVRLARPRFAAEVGAATVNNSAIARQKLRRARRTARAGTLGISDSAGMVSADFRTALRGPS